MDGRPEEAPMLYERSLAIESRLQTVLRLIGSGRYCTPQLAEEVGVSVPTISRDVTALRQRGHAIRAERVGASWRYVLVPTPANDSQPRPATAPRRPR
jgi:predicted DNA-binding transcriptional regulator YafY